MPAGETLILLDEIQECPAARTAVKFLVEDGRWRYVETGSLLGIRLEEVKSIPVGYEEIVSMYPLHFEEFLWGAGIQDSVIDLLRVSLKEEKEVPDYIHKRMQKLFLTWMTIGGMPEVCQRFFDNAALVDCIRLQQMIMTTFDADITQYAAKSQRVQILDVFRAVPSQLDKQNQRFFITHIQKNARPINSNPAWPGSSSQEPRFHAATWKNHRFLCARTKSETFSNSSCWTRACCAPVIKVSSFL